MNRPEPRLTASLVLYNTPEALFARAISSFLDSPGTGTLFVVDNSEAAVSSLLFNSNRVNYFHVGRNLGFGAAHNVAIAKACDSSDFHLILNPDVNFGSTVLPGLIDVLRRHSDIGVVMPKILYPNGNLQRLCKLLPTPMDLIFRRFIPAKGIQDRVNASYELHELPQDRMSDVPCLSGCFLLVRTSVLQNIGGFDERFFMYMEDVDLVRRIGDLARTVYVPEFHVVHNYAKGSYRSGHLLRLHMRSALRYFAKWGWWQDPGRRLRNHAVRGMLSAGTAEPRPRRD